MRQNIARELAELFLGDNQNKPEAKEAVIQAGTRIIESLLAEQKAELIKQIQDLITAEIAIAHTKDAGGKTSRLTSLYLAVTKLK